MDVSTRQAAEADLAGKAAQYRPDELARYAQRVMDWLHPDGDLTDTERARKRGITLSNQQYDGMSRLSGYLTPQARATFEAVLAKLAAPGATNPDDHTPVIDTTPDAAAIDRDTRSQAQRNHDGLLAGLRALLASGKLGQHNGLPVSIVVTTTLTDLQTGAGKGFTGGGTLLPMADVIRMTSHAHHYSPASGRYPQAIFDHGTPLALYHTKRLASPAQRIMLFANDRGCTKPGCDAPAYHSQAHHVTAWTSTGRTDITDLTLACGPDNRLAEKGWTTRKNTHGHTEWLPPPHLDHGQPRVGAPASKRMSGQRPSTAVAVGNDPANAVHTSGNAYRANDINRRQDRFASITAPARRITDRRNANCAGVGSVSGVRSNTSLARVRTSASMTSDLLLPTIAPRSRAQCRAPAMCMVSPAFSTAIVSGSHVIEVGSTVASISS